MQFRVRLEEDRLCTLVMIGVRPDGTKELLAVEDGSRESTGRLGDGPPGSETPRLARAGRPRRRQRARPLGGGRPRVAGHTRAALLVHRLANVLDKLPKRLQPKAKQALHAIMQAPTCTDAEAGMDAFRGRVRREVSPKR